MEYAVAIRPYCNRNRLFASLSVIVLLLSIFLAGSFYHVLPPFVVLALHHAPYPLQVATNTEQSTLRIIFTSAPTSKGPVFVESEASRIMCESLMSDSRGLLVVYGPFASGKTRTIRECVRRSVLSGRGAVSIRAPTAKSDVENLNVWLRKALRIPIQSDSYSQPWHELLPRGIGPVSLVIDQAEKLFEWDVPVKPWIVSLAEESIDKANNPFKVLLAVNDPKIYAEILKWNGGKKIRGLLAGSEFRLSSAQLSLLFDTMLPKQPLSRDLNTTAVRELAIQTGSAGFVVDEVFDSDARYNYTQLETRAKEHTERWSPI